MSQWFNHKNDFQRALNGEHEFQAKTGKWQWRLPVRTDGRPEHAPVRMGVLNIKSDMRGIVLRPDDVLTLAIEGDDLCHIKM